MAQIVSEETDFRTDVQTQEVEQKQSTDSTINVTISNQNTDIVGSLMDNSLYLGIIAITLVGIVAVSVSKKAGSTSNNINIGKVGDRADHVSKDYSTTTNVDNRDGVMQRSNIGGGGDIDEKLVALKEKYDKGLIGEDVYKEMQKELLGKM